MKPSATNRGYTPALCQIIQEGKRLGVAEDDIESQPRIQRFMEKCGVSALVDLPREGQWALVNNLRRIKDRDDLT